MLLDQRLERSRVCCAAMPSVPCFDSRLELAACKTLASVENRGPVSSQSKSQGRRPPVLKKINHNLRLLGVVPILMDMTAHLPREGEQPMIVVDIFKTRRPLAPPRRAADGF